MKSKIILLVLTVIALSLSAVAPQPPQSHPLSEIAPIDTDLNMENQDVRNVSRLLLNDGSGSSALLLEGFSLTHEGGAQQLVLDYQNDEWDIENSDLDMGNNEIKGVDSLSNGTADTLELGNNGNVRMPKGGLDVGDRVKSNSGFQLGAGATTTKYGWGQVYIGNQDSWRINIDGADVLNATSNGNVKIPNGDLNMGSGNIDSVSMVNSGGSNLAVGSHLDVNAPVNTGNALDLGGTLGVDGGIESYSGIDMNGNNISSSDGEMCIGEYC